jgi:LPXTG-motif cell wall-anchored protein
MHRKFALSVAGVAGAAVSAPSLAEDIVITMHLDYWQAEHGMLLSGASGSLTSYTLNGDPYAFASGSATVTNSSLEDWSSTIDPYTSGYRWLIEASVGEGEYEVRLTDSYGDGWTTGDVTGADAFSVTGVGGTIVSGDTLIAFDNGSSQTGTIVVVAPAPGGIALLGLAGISGRRRKRS